MSPLAISTLLLFGIATVGCGSSDNQGSCAYRYDEASSDNSIPQGLEACVDGWKADRCNAGAMSAASQNLPTSAYTFTAGGTCASLGYKACDANRGTSYKVCPDVLAAQHPLAKSPSADVERERMPEATSLAAPIAVPADAPSLGPANATSVLQVFGDLDDPFTLRMLPALRAAIKRNPELKIVFRHHPLTFHKKAPLAHQAAIEAYTQKGNDGFWAMADLIAQNRNLDRGSLDEYAKTIGLDLAAFGKALDAGTHAARVAQDATIAEQAGLVVTPMSVIDTRISRGQLTDDRLDAFVAVK